MAFSVNKKTLVEWKHTATSFIRRNHTISIILIGIVLLSIPFTVWLVSKTTFLRSKAAESLPIIAAHSGTISGKAKLLVDKLGIKYVQLGGDGIFTYGSDYNMLHRCVRSPSPGTTNAFSDTTDCPTRNDYWMIANESEKSSLASCPGPASQSFPYNKTDSPVSFEWLPHTDENGNKNFIAHLKTDFTTVTHPCGDGYYTWNTIHPFGPYPLAHKTILDLSMAYTDIIRDGHNRIIIGWTITSGNGQAYEMEFDIASTDIFYNRFASDPIVVQFDFDKNNYRHFFEINTQMLNKMGAGLPTITIPRGKLTDVHLDLYKVLDWMIGNGKIPNDTTANPYKTTGFYFGSEIRQEKANANMSDVQVTNVRISELK